MSELRPMQRLFLNEVKNHIKFLTNSAKIEAEAIFRAEAVKAFQGVQDDALCRHVVKILTDNDATILRTLISQIISSSGSPAPTAAAVAVPAAAPTAPAPPAAASAPARAAASAGEAKTPVRHGGRGVAAPHVPAQPSGAVVVTASGVQMDGHSHMTPTRQPRNTAGPSNSSNSSTPRRSNQHHQHQADEQSAEPHTPQRSGDGLAPGVSPNETPRKSASKNPAHPHLHAGRAGSAAGSQQTTPRHREGASGPASPKHDGGHHTPGRRRLDLQKGDGHHHEGQHGHAAEIQTPASSSHHSIDGGAADGESSATDTPGSAPSSDGTKLRKRNRPPKHIRLARKEEEERKAQEAGGAVGGTATGEGSGNSTPLRPFHIKDHSHGNGNGNGSAASSGRATPLRNSPKRQEKQAKSRTCPLWPNCNDPACTLFHFGSAAPSSNVASPAVAAAALKTAEHVE